MVRDFQRVVGSEARELVGAAIGAWTSGLSQSRGGTCHDAPEVATGGLFVVAGAATACNVEPVFVDVPDAKVAAVAPVAAVGLGRVTTMAAAPRTPAAPAPKVRADIQASPLLRASCRGEPGVGELVMVLRSRFWGTALLVFQAYRFQHSAVWSLGASSDLPMRSGSKGFDRRASSRDCRRSTWRHQFRVGDQERDLVRGCLVFCRGKSEGPG